MQGTERDRVTVCKRRIRDYSGSGGGDFHSGEIRGALCWRLGDEARCFDKSGPLVEPLSHKNHISEPRDGPHAVSCRRRELEEISLAKIRDKQDQQKEKCCAAY